MNVPWYYAAGGETHGPLDWAGLRAAARAGRFGPADHVWTPGYGTEWKKASELGTLFPPPPAPSGPEAEAPSEPEAAPDAAPPPLRNLRVVERSPFRPPAPDGRTSAPPRVLQSLRNAWTNLRTILFEPFSLRRAGVFCLCALLLFLGAQSELPSGADDPEARSRLEAAGPGLAALAELRDGIVLRAARLRDEAGDLDRPDALRAAAGAALRDLGGAMRTQCAAILDWTRTASAMQRLTVFGLSALLLPALCALRCWFLSRAWTLFPLRVYRRDEPLLLSWAEAQRPAHALFRGLFALRLGLLALQAVATAHAVQFFGTMPAGAPVTARTAAAGLGIFVVPLLLGGLLGAFVRDLVVPRLLLLRLPFRAAMRAAAHDLGLWGLRYLCLLFALLFLEAQVAGAVLALTAAAGLPPVLLPVLWAVPAMPFELLRTLLALDMLFRIRPEAREAVPPRLLLAVRTIRRPRTGGAR